MRASKKDINTGLIAIKKLAFQAFRNGAINETIRLLNAYSSIAGQFNFVYADDDIEYLHKKIAEIGIHIKERIESDSNRWVLYDDFCTTYVLGLQWIEAMAFSGKSILYITTRNIDKENRHKNIIDSIARFPNVKIVIIPQGEVLDRAQRVYNEVVGFGPSKIVLHKYATQSTIDYILPVLPASITKYLINLSDQTFWIGCRSIDYCLEFRPFGASVSLQRRRLRYEQLLMVPFYPADDKNEFQGFPPECSNNKLIVFSGGDYYKTLDANRTYWNLIKRLLQKYPQIVFLFATKNIPEGDSEIRRFISENHFEGRFIYIQFRPDIYQVFEHCDIYMGTCPTSGSLMSQLAAIHAKPILQYYSPGTPDDETEQALCINNVVNISYTKEEGFFEEAHKLITDSNYRESRGLEIQRAMMQHNQFNELVINTLTSNKSQFLISDYFIEFKNLDNRWLFLEKAGYVQTLSYIYSLLGARKCLIMAPSVFLKKNVNRIVSILKHDN